MTASMRTPAAASSDEGVRAEQLRLVLGGLAQSVATGVMVSTLMLAVLWPLASHRVLFSWYAAFLALRATVALFSYRALRAPRGPARDRRTERILFAAKLAEGLIYGWLLAIGLPLEEPPVSILLMSLMGAVCGNGVSLLAPRRHLYLALAVPIAVLAVATLWPLSGVAYHVLAIFCVLYVAGQYGQVVLASRRVREAIDLRFENTALVAQLRDETAAARLARRDAEQANVAKSRFLAAASHDLRQPVHALGLFLQALGQTALAERQRQILGQAQAATVASTDMLNTLLDFSRLEAGVVAPQPRAYALQPLLDKLETDLGPLADAKGLIYRSPPCDAAVVSDQALLELVLRNLILNAIRYTERGGLVVACRRRGAGLLIGVYDTGIGIPADQHEEVFREFHQLGNPERDRRKGLGLGLAIARRLAASLDHPLTLASTVGRGSAFRILVPLAPGPAVEPPAYIPALVGPPTDGAAVDGLPADGLPADGMAADGMAVTSLAGARILVVEDDATVREAMEQLLASWGCRCRAVASPDEALALLDEEPAPDVLVCDYRLREGVTGTEAIALLRRRWRMAIPAVIITGDTAPARLREAMDSGVPVIHKPVAPDRLYRELQKVVPQGRLPAEADLTRQPG